MKVYPPRDIRPFVMYCVNGKPRSSLLIESTDSMIIWQDKDVQSELFACIGFILQQLWPVMSLVVWACASVVFRGDLEKAVFAVFNISIYRI